MATRIHRVEDPDDPTVADHRRLNDTSFRRSVERPGPFGGGCVMVEGWLAVERMLAGPHRVRSILVDERRLPRLEELLGAPGAGRTRDVPVLVAAPEVVAAVVGFDLHRGVVAAIDRPRPRDPDALVRRSRRLLVVEGVTDGENVGALFRTAAALGADGVVVDTATADPWSRRAVRTSVGHVLALPWATWTIDATMRALEDAGHLLVALTPRGEVDLRDVEVDAGRDVAIAVGAEGPGLSDAVLDAASVQARIEMARGIDSLNVATAAALAAWHLFR